MQALIEFILKQLKYLWPITIVSEWMLGLRIRRGIIVGEVKPGIVWRILFLDEIKTWPKTEVAIDLETASVITKCGRSIAISGNLAYKLVDIAKCWKTLWSMESSLSKMAIAVLASSVAQMEFSQLQHSRMESEEELRQKIDRVSLEWGLTITRLHLTDCVPLRAYRHYVDGMRGN